MEKKNENIFMASLWMVGLSLVLFFLPAINGLIGGAVGGYKAGNWKRALGAAILPAILVGIGLWLIFALFDAAVLGFVAGTAVGILILIAEVGIFVGAVAGGLIAQNKSKPQI